MYAEKTKYRVVYEHTTLSLHDRVIVYMHVMHIFYQHVYVVCV